MVKHQNTWRVTVALSRMWRLNKQLSVRTRKNVIGVEIMFCFKKCQAYYANYIYESNENGIQK